MDMLRTKFNRKSAPMYYARDRRTGQLIGLPGDRTPNIDWYDEETHKGHLSCLCCNAPVHFNKGSDVVKGSRERGASHHFKLNRSSNHEDGCENAKASSLNERPVNGYRLNFNVASASYIEDPKDVPDNLQSVSLKSMQDQADFMRLNNLTMLHNWWSVFREHAVRWPNYMLSDQDPECKINLINTVSMMLRNGERSQFASLELHVDKKKILHPFGWHGKTTIKGKPVIANSGDRDGRRHIIMPRYSFETEPMSDDDNNEELTKFFNEKESDTFLAHGIAELAIDKKTDVTFYYFEIPLTTPNQVIRESLDNLLKENRLHQLKKQELALRLA